MLNLQRVAMFLAVVDAGSFTAAAATLGQTKAVVSFNIRQLEAELGVALLLRTTRKLALTEAGNTFYQRGAELLQQTENLLQDVQQNHQSLSGELRITSTPEYGAERVIPALVAFRAAHPALRIRHVSSSYHADLASERFDLAIRLGTLSDSSYRAALIDRFGIIPVASPGWLQQHPITTLEELAAADWIIHNCLQSPLNWQISDSQQQPVTFQINSAPMFSADSAAALLSFALAGGGVALLPDWLALPAIRQGTLRQLLPDYTFPAQGVYAVYPDSRHITAKVRTFIDFMREWSGKRWL